jgi:hypothetical protein
MRDGNTRGTNQSSGDSGEICIVGKRPLSLIKRLRLWASGFHQRDVLFGKLNPYVKKKSPNISIRGL